MFEVTADDINEALTGGIPDWDQGDVVNLMITAVEDTVKDDNPILILSTTVVSEKNKGKPYKEFFRMQYPSRKGAFVRLLLSFYTKEQLPLLKGNFSGLIGQTLTSKASVKHAEGGKKFVNLNGLARLETTPVVPGLANAAGPVVNGQATMDSMPF